MDESGEKVGNLSPIKYSDNIVFREKEQEEIIKYFMDLNLDFIKNFCDIYDIPKRGNKPDYEKRIIENINEGVINYSNLIDFVDEIEKYGKQHVLLYEGSETILNNWNNNENVNEILKGNKLLKYRNTRLPIILPQGLALSSIEYVQNRRLEIYAVEPHYHIERIQEYDEQKEIEEKDLNIELKAYMRNSRRGFVIFKWDLVLNKASLHIMQLPRGLTYEDMKERFKALISPWFDLNQFTQLDLKQVIKKLHELEETSNPETRSHGLGYRSIGGRSVDARSSNPEDSVLGEDFIDSAMRGIRRRSVGRIGNFYWLINTVPNNSTDEDSDETIINPLEEEIRTVIIGKENRINFTRPNKKEDLEYVLSRVRDLC
jgi:hypothetical protein